MQPVVQRLHLDADQLEVLGAELGELGVCRDEVRDEEGVILRVLDDERAEGLPRQRLQFGRSRIREARLHWDSMRGSITRGADLILDQHNVGRQHHQPATRVLELHGPVPLFNRPRQREEQVEVPIVEDVRRRRPRPTVARRVRVAPSEGVRAR